jgi:hypothetical protein
MRAISTILPAIFALMSPALAATTRCTRDWEKVGEIG